MNKIPISEIIIFPRKRNPKDIESLKLSIKELGLLNPITINQHKVLVAGYHRLLACKELGWQEVPVTIMKYETLQSEMAQIDENIVRNQLTALEYAEQLNRRKEIYEILHPNAKPEDARNCYLKHNLSSSNDYRTTKPVTFLNDVVAKTNKSESIIRQYIQIGSNLSKEVIAKLKNTSIENNFVELLALSRIQPAEKQKELIEKVLSGEVKNIRAAIRLENPLKAKKIDLEKDTVPTKLYRCLLEELSDLKIKYFRLEQNYSTLLNQQQKPQPEV